MDEFEHQKLAQEGIISRVIAAIDGPAFRRALERGSGKDKEFVADQFLDYFRDHPDFFEGTPFGGQQAFLDFLAYCGLEDLIVKQVRKAESPLSPV